MGVDNSENTPSDRLGALFGLVGPPSPATGKTVEPPVNPPSEPVETVIQPVSAPIVGKKPETFNKPAHKATDEEPFEADIEPNPKPKGGKRPGAGRPRKGAGAIIGTVAPPATTEQGGEITVHEPSFRVVTGSKTIEEVIEANGVALVEDALVRASRAGESKDGFDKMVYLEVLKLAMPKAKNRIAKPMQPAEAKATIEALDRLIAANAGVEDAEFIDRKAGSGG